jgi:hypothetical protein
MSALQMLASAVLVGLLSLILLGILAAITYVGLMLVLVVAGMVATVVFVAMILVAFTGGFDRRPLLPSFAPRALPPPRP